MLVSNHESLGDILALFGLYRPFKWVSKASVFKVPFLGWNMTLNGYVPLLRGDAQSVSRMLDHCDRWLSRGVPVLMFPEGTRSADGEVKAFKDGAFRMAVKQGCPVIPIAISGMRTSLPKHGFVIRQSVHCVVRVLAPLDPAAQPDATVYVSQSGGALGALVAADALAPLAASWDTIDTCALRVVNAYGDGSEVLNVEPDAIAARAQKRRDREAKGLAREARRRRAPRVREEEVDLAPPARGAAAG